MVARTNKAYLTGEARREIEDRLIAIATAEGPVSIRHLFYRAATEFPDRITKDKGRRAQGQRHREQAAMGGAHSMAPRARLEPLPALRWRLSGCRRLSHHARESLSRERMGAPSP